MTGTEATEMGTGLTEATGVIEATGEIEEIEGATDTEIEIGEIEEIEGATGTEIGAVEIENDREAGAAGIPREKRGIKGMLVEIMTGQKGQTGAKSPLFMLHLRKSTGLPTSRRRRSE